MTEAEATAARRKAVFDKIEADQKEYDVKKREEKFESLNPPSFPIIGNKIRGSSPDDQI